MNTAHRSRVLVVSVIIVALGLAAPLVGSAPHVNAVVYLLATSLLSFELLDVGARLWLRRTAVARPARVENTLRWTAKVGQPYALIMAVHNVQRDIDDLRKAFGPHKSRTWIIDDCSTDDTVSLLRRDGWHCLSAQVNRKKPGAIRELLRRLPKAIKTVVVLDPDARLKDVGLLQASDLENVIRAFQRSGAAACCPRIQIRDHGFLGIFQALECELAFSLGRKGMSPYCVTSGVSIYDREALEQALEHHSMSVYAEDLENTLILLARGGKILFDDGLVIETDPKISVRSWFSQRVGWSFGLIRVVRLKRRDILRIAHSGAWPFYNFAIYMCLLTVVLLPIKAAGILLLALSFANGLDSFFSLNLIPDNALTDPRYFAVTYTGYTLLVAATMLELKPRVSVSTLLVAVPLFVFYAAAHVVPIATGYLNWLVFKAFGRRLYRDHYSTDDDLFPAAVGMGAKERAP
jgi:cellulose synthase/poly-beta-1,6-N-acetylglucosamine synthase-like glycosyltransferase